MTKLNTQDIRQPPIKQDWFCLCEACLSWQPLPPDKKGDRYSPLRLDPLQLQNNKVIKWICSSCYTEFRFEEARPKVENGEIRS